VSVDRGRDVVRFLVDHLTTAAGFDAAFVAEFLPSNLFHTVAVSYRGAAEPDFTHECAGSPCERIRDGEVVVVEAGVRARFPGQPLLERANAESFIGVPLRGEKGDVTGLLAAVGTEPAQAGALRVALLELVAFRAAAELSRDRREERLEFQAQLLASVQHAVIAVAPSGTVTYWNEAAERLYGWREQDALGRQVTELIRTSESPEGSLRGLVSASQSEDVRETELLVQREHGAPFWARFSVHEMRDASGAQRGVILVSADATAAREAREALARSEQQFRTIIEHSPYGIYRSTLEGRFLSVNPALVRMLGYSSEEELLRADLGRDLYTDPGERDRLIVKYSQATGWICEETTWRRRDRTPLPLRLTGRAVRDDAKRVIGFEMFVEDLTEQQKTERQLRHAQRMEAVGRLVGGMAHDSNNILTAVLANADLIAAALPESAPFHAELDDIRSSGRRGADLVRKLLAFSRQEALAVKPTSLPPLLDETRSILARLLPESVAIELRLEKELPAVRADAGALYQILLNVATNARDAMPEGGTLRIEARAEPDLGRVRLTMADTGTGMQPDVLERAFEPFFTTKPVGKGSGLGLSMVHGLMRQQGGSVEIESTPGQGTAVHLFLVAVATEDIATAMPSSPARGGSETVLVVEDQADVRRLAKRVLERAGYTVLTAQDGEDALRILLGRRTGIHLVVTDVVMPKQGGLRLYRAAQQLGVRAKWLFTSGYTELGTGEYPAFDPDLPMLQKPWAVDDLLRAVRTELDSSE
jgi:PAS domain S-box-containing protein